MNPEVVSLAGAIHAERTWARMPALVRALEEAGCDREDFLALAIVRLIVWARSRRSVGAGARRSPRFQAGTGPNL